MKPLVIPVLLIAVGAVLWFGVLGPRFPALSLGQPGGATLHLVGGFVALLGLGLLAGELFGTDSRLQQARASSNAVLSSSAFLATIASYLLCLLVAAAAGQATETGPDAMGTTLLPIACNFALLASATWLALTIGRHWQSLSVQERLVTVGVVAATLPWLLFTWYIFGFMAHHRN